MLLSMLSVLLDVMHLSLWLIALGLYSQFALFYVRGIRRLWITCLHQQCKFLSRVSTLTRDIDIAILSVCLSVRPSVRDTFNGIV